MSIDRCQSVAPGQWDDLAALYEQAPVGLCVLDTELRFVRVNARFAALNQLPALAHLGQSIGEIAPGMAVGLAPLLYQAMLYGSSVDKAKVEGAHAFAPNKQRVWRVSVHPMRDETGRIIGLNLAVDEEPVNIELEELRGITNALPGLISYVDRDGRYRFVNAAYAQWLGRSPSDLIGRPVQEWLHPTTYAQAKPWMDAALEGRHVRFELPVKSSDQSLRHILITYAPHMDPHQTPLGYIALVMDITERRQAEAALQESEMRFRATFEQAAVGLAHISLDGKWQRVNRRLCEILDYTYDELLQKNFQDITHPDDRSVDLARMQRLVSGEIDGYQVEKCFIGRGNSTIWVNLTISLARTPDAGASQNFIAVVEDISERKAVETRMAFLAEASQVLASTLVYERSAQAVVDLVVPRLADWSTVNILRPGGVVESVASAHVEPARAFQLGGLIQRYPLSINDNEGTPQVMRTGKSLFYPQVTDELFRQDERLRLLGQIGLSSLLIVPLRARGHTIGAMTLARCGEREAYTETDLHFVEDLAQRIALAVENARLYQEARDAEVQLRHLNDTLERRVMERTSDLERSNRELDQFAYVASHDLKAPLRAIENLATWITEDAGDRLPPGSQEHMARLRSRVQRMDRLLDDLLAYSRVGRIAHQPQVVDSALLVRDLWDVLGPGPGFRLVLDEPMPSFVTARVPFETVLRNLISNALKHHHGQGGEIRVSALVMDTAIEFTITDDGPGIASEFHGRIFEMFQTLHPRDKVEGSGMGLALVKKIVENQGGTIRVRSAEGQGTQFQFTWPVEPG